MLNLTKKNIIMDTESLTTFLEYRRLVVKSENISKKMEEFQDKIKDLLYSKDGRISDVFLDSIELWSEIYDLHLDMLMLENKIVEILKNK